MQTGATPAAACLVCPGGHGAPRCAALLLLPPLLFLCLYARALDYDFAWMDETEIRDGALVLPPGAMGEAFARPLHADPGYGVELRNPYYRPLQLLWVSALHRVSGPQPRGYRWASLALGACSMLVFAGLAWGLFGRVGPALAAALLAAAHPAGLEAYLWLSGVSEGMSALGILLSLGAAWLCLRARSPGTGLALGSLSVLALGLALLSKEKAVVTPVLLLAGLASGAMADGASRDAGGIARPAVRRRAIGLLAAQAVTLAAYAVARSFVLGGDPPLLPPIGGDPTTHLRSALAAWPGNLAWLLVPLHSTTSDVVRVVRSPFDPMPWLGGTLAAVSVPGWVLLRRSGRPVAAFGLAWVWLAYLPTSGLIPLLHARSERYLFLSVFGAALLAAALLAPWLRSGAPRTQRWLAVGTATLAIAFLGQRTWARTPAWSSTETLFRADVSRDPDFREGRHHLARTLFEQGRYAEARRQVRLLTAEPPQPADRRSFVNEIGVHELACLVELGRRRYLEAEAVVDRLDERQPRLARTPGLQTCRAQAMAARGRTREALGVFLEVAQTLPAPLSASLALQIAEAHARLGEPSEARRWLDRAGPRTPDERRQALKVKRLLARPSSGAGLPSRRPGPRRRGDPGGTVPDDAGASP